MLYWGYCGYKIKSNPTTQEPRRSTLETDQSLGCHGRKDHDAVGRGGLQKAVGSDQKI